MSIGPQSQEKFGTSKVEKTRNAIKKVMQNYFNKPLYYIFYIMLALTVGGLFFNMEFPVEYYALLIFLGCANFFGYVYNEYIKHKDLRTVQSAE